MWTSACAHAIAPPAEPESPAPPPSQSLLRVDYHGPDGQGRLRLVLRRWSSDRFRLDADDLLGRALWTLRVAGDGLTLIDHRARAYCRGTADVSIPERGLSHVPVRALAGVLLGELPVAPPPGAGGGDRVDFVDARGRRWTATLDGGAPVSWAMWGDGEPLVWWQGDARGGILSHRAGGQFRWRVAVSEELAAGGEEPAEPPAPEGYELGSCGGAPANGAASGPGRGVVSGLPAGI